MVEGRPRRIMTGAPVPIGADAIVRVEDTTEQDGFVMASAAVPYGMHVRPAGDDITSGEVVVPAGTELGPGELAVLASMGLSPLAVRRGPKVALLVTGDELVDPEAQPAPGQIRDSNSVALSALIPNAGAELIPLGRSRRQPRSGSDVFEAGFACRSRRLLRGRGGRTLRLRQRRRRGVRSDLSLASGDAARQTHSARTAQGHSVPGPAW